MSAGEDLLIMYVFLLPRAYPTVFAEKEQEEKYTVTLQLHWFQLKTAAIEKQKRVNVS